LTTDHSRPTTSLSPCRLRSKLSNLTDLVLAILAILAILMILWYLHVFQQTTSFNVQVTKRGLSCHTRNIFMLTNLTCPISRLKGLGLGLHYSTEITPQTDWEG